MQFCKSENSVVQLVQDILAYREARARIVNKRAFDREFRGFARRR